MRQFFYKKIIILIISLFLVSCTMKPKLVYIPTPVDCPKPKLSPPLGYPALSSNASSSEFVRWCIVSQVMCRSDNKALRELLK